jgi:hypothetical protein
MFRAARAHASDILRFQKVPAPGRNCAAGSNAKKREKTRKKMAGDKNQ